MTTLVTPVSPAMPTLHESSGADPQRDRRVPLTHLKRGERAIVDCSTLTHLPEEDRCLLRAMGMYDRCTVRVCRSGTPCIVQIDSTRLGLSGAVARKILVTPCHDPDAERG